MNWKALDKTETNLFKGLAIIMIVTHNFLHLFPIPEENEFNFSESRFNNLLNLLWNEPENSIRGLLSFFGHFGVQIFIFLSAYGLTKKYLSTQPKFWSFLWGRVLKIYPTFILAIILWAMIYGWLWNNGGILGPLQVIYSNFGSLFLKLTLLSNFVPREAIAIVGPWWFIPFIFQFYLFFSLLLKLYEHWGSKGLFVISIFSIGFNLFFNGRVFSVNLYPTLIGHLPELCLGIYFSKNDLNRIRIHYLLFFVALITNILGNIYEPLWHLNHISFLIILLFLFNFLVNKIKNNELSKKTILFFGYISMPLFLVNGFLRRPLINWALQYDHWFITIIFCLIFLIISVLVSLVLLHSEKFLRSLIKKYSNINLKTE